MALTLSTEYESLKHDVNTLFSRFYQKQSVRFEDFVSEWKEMNFGCIFAATFRNTSSAKMRITERLFRVASEFLSEESTFLYRVAAVYMFYAVYFRQLTSTKVKIRMTPTMWKDLMDFFNIVIEHQHLDVAYIIQTLRKQQAFIFVAFPKFLLFGRHEFMMGIEGATSLRHTFEADKYINELVSRNESVDMLQRVQDEYEQVKQKVMQESTEDERSYLSKVLYYSNSHFPREFQKLVESHSTKRKNSTIPKPDSEMDITQRPVLSQLQELNERKEMAPVEESEVTKRMSAISKIKAKSWKSSVSTSPNKRRRKNNAAEEEDEEGESVQDLKNIIYKKSAMLQPVPAPLKKPINHPMRYKVANRLPDDF